MVTKSLHGSGEGYRFAAGAGAEGVKVVGLMDPAMKCTQPSAMTKLAPPVCSLRKAPYSASGLLSCLLIP